MQIRSSWYTILIFHNSSRRGENSWNQNINAVIIFGQRFFLLLLFCFISGGMKESEFWFTGARSWLRFLREIHLNVIYFHFCTTERLTTMRAQLDTHVVLCWQWHLICQHSSGLVSSHVHTVHNLYLTEDTLSPIAKMCSQIGLLSLCHFPLR